MPLFPELLGLAPNEENADIIQGVASITAQEGKALTGYYDLPYINKEFGAIQIILRTQKQYDGKKEFLNITGIDTHASGQCVWHVALISPGAHGDDWLVRAPIVKRTDNRGAAVINIVNADVLPSFRPNDIISLQVIGIPDSIDYYSDEEQFLKDFTKGSKDRLIPAEGAIVPLGLLSGFGAPIEDGDPSKDLVLIRGRVKYFHIIPFDLNEDVSFKLLRCTIDTEFGPLEIVHTFEAVSEDQRQNLKEGAVVSFYGRLSGDAAIHDYGSGAIKDEEHCLLLLRDIICGGNPERALGVLADDVQYSALRQDSQITGRKPVAERIGSLGKHYAGGAAAELCTVEQILKNDEAKLNAGSRCIALSRDGGITYPVLLSISIDDAGNIIKITEEQADSYRMELEKSPLDDGSLLNNADIPKSVAELIFDHAIHDNILAIDAKIQDVINGSYSMEFNNNIDYVSQALNYEFDDLDETIANIFGYLFAKAIELEHNVGPSYGVEDPTRVCHYNIGDALDGKITGDLNKKQLIRLQEAMDLGKQFYFDFKFYHQILGSGELFDSGFWEEFKNALTAVQYIGAAYSQMCLADGGGGLVS